MKTAYIFIVGNSRSGTTLMGRILGLNDEIFTFEELHFFEQLWSIKDKNKTINASEAEMLYAQLLKNQSTGYLSKYDFKKFRDEAKATLQDNVRETVSRIDVFKTFLINEVEKHGKRIPCEQTPRNILYIDDILQLIPNAKILAMVRDPRDVVLSQKYKWKRRFLGAKNIPLSESLRSWINYHPITISRLWRENFRILDTHEKHPSVLVIKFESLIYQPEIELHKICDFIGVEFSEKMMNVAFKGSSNKADKNLQGIQKNTGNWRSGGLTKSEIFLTQIICQQEMNRLGYEMCGVKPNKVRLFFCKLAFPFKLSSSLILNLHRMKNIRESLTKRISLLKN
ncbi:MAG: sulfotransferase [Cyclobacteriaceae bacterium]|nr:sulfotransferase [Cyclobacteriaceae bacterium]